MAIEHLILKRTGSEQQLMDVVQMVESIAMHLCVNITYQTECKMSVYIRGGAAKLERTSVNKEWL